MATPRAQPPQRAFHENADRHLTAIAVAPSLRRRQRGGEQMGQPNLRVGIIAGVMISLTSAVAASRVSDSPLLAFGEVAIVGLLCTLLAVGLVAYGRRGTGAS